MALINTFLFPWINCISFYLSWRISISFLFISESLNFLMMQYLTSCRVDQRLSNSSIINHITEYNNFYKYISLYFLLFLHNLYRNSGTYWNYNVLMRWVIIRSVKKKINPSEPIGKSLDNLGIIFLEESTSLY